MIYSKIIAPLKSIPISLCWAITFVRLCLLDWCSPNYQIDVRTKTFYLYLHRWEWAHMNTENLLCQCMWNIHLWKCHKADRKVQYNNLRPNSVLVLKWSFNRMPMNANGSRRNRFKAKAKPSMGQMPLNRFPYIRLGMLKRDIQKELEIIKNKKRSYILLSSLQELKWNIVAYVGFILFFWRPFFL